MAVQRHWIQPSNGTHTAGDYVGTVRVVDDDGNVVDFDTQTITTTEESVDATGTTVPAKATLVAGTDGTNTTALKVNSSGELLPARSSTEAYGTVAIGTSAAVIKAAKTTRLELVVQNVHASNVLYIGKDSSVATTTGIRLLPGESRVYTNYTGDVYGIASAASTDVRYEEIG